MASPANDTDGLTALTWLASTGRTHLSVVRRQFDWRRLAVDRELRRALDGLAAVLDQLDAHAGTVAKDSR